MTDEASRLRPDPAESEATAKAPTFAELFAAANPGERDYSRLLLAVCGSLMVVAMSVCGAALLDRVRLPNVAPRPMQELGSGPIDGSKLLRDVLEGQQQAAAWDPGMVGSQEARSTKNTADKRQGMMPLYPRKGQTQEQMKKIEAAPDDGVDPEYAALWGSGDRYAALGRRASSEAAEAVTEKEGLDSPKGSGSVLPARLLDRVAGTPAGAPVIAILTRKQRLGDLILPVNTEIHGTVAGTGAEETRIFLNFEFVRLRDGRVVPIRGVARDPQGRHGIPAKRLFGKGAAGSIGLASASRAFRQVGRHLAGQVGDAVGAGLEGATDSATDKAQRADRDEHVLVAEPGVSISIYIFGVS